MVDEAFEYLSACNFKTREMSYTYKTTPDNVR